MNLEKQSDINNYLQILNTPIGMKNDTGKILAATIFEYFPLALKEVAKVATHGAGVYARNSWSTVPDKEIRYEDAMIRHMLDMYSGEEFDKDSKLAHRAHFVWNALATLQMYLEKKNIDNTFGLVKLEMV